MKTEPSFAALLQAYFTDRLVGQRNASPHTIASHRDTFRLLLGFAQKALKKAPAALAIADLDAPFIGRFLDHVEKDRGNQPQTRNLRLAAIHSFFHYVALQEPSLGALAQRVLSIPSKRHKSKPVDFLTRAEIDALVAAPDQSTWAGRRDRTWLLVAVQTGLRASELVGLRCEDVVLGTGAHVRCLGKGRNYAKVEVMQRWYSSDSAGAILKLYLAWGRSSRKTGGICEKTGCFRFRPATAPLQECLGSSPHGGQPPWHNSQWLRVGFARARVHAWRDTPSRPGS